MPAEKASTEAKSIFSLAVEELSDENWPRYRALRVKSLLNDPQAFGGDFEAIKNAPDLEWQTKMQTLKPIIAMVNDQDVGLMIVEPIAGDFQSTCWIGGCWVDPAFRGMGVMREMFNFIDSVAEEKNWARQGLGVWEDNLIAIGVYKSLGFKSVGKPKPSTSKPGKFYQRMIRNSEK